MSSILKYVKHEKLSSLTDIACTSWGVFKAHRLLFKRPEKSAPKFKFHTGCVMFLNFRLTVTTVMTQRTCHNAAN